MVNDDKNAKPSGSKTTVDQPNEIYAATSIKIPPFWSERPELWFAQIEGQFVTHKVHSENARFNQVIGNLDGKILQYVTDAVLHPPDENRYTNLKNKLIESFAQSGQQKITKLLSELTLGDQRPSQLLNRQRELAGNVVNEDFLKNLWLRQLPVTVQAVLAVSAGDLSELGKLADKIMEVHAPQQQLAPVSMKSSNSTIATLEAKIDSLTKDLQQLQSSKNRGRSRSRSRPNGRANTPNKREYDTCWYHYKFGDAATKCRDPCKKSKN